MFNGLIANNNLESKLHIFKNHKSAINSVTISIYGDRKTQEPRDLDNGRTLFVERCGTCHAFKEAGTQSEVAPDLDAAFQAARNTGMDSDTIEGVVESQIGLSLIHISEP